MCQQGLCGLLGNTICLFVKYSPSLAHPLFLCLLPSQCLLVMKIAGKWGTWGGWGAQLSWVAKTNLPLETCTFLQKGIPNLWCLCFTLSFFMAKMWMLWDHKGFIFNQTESNKKTPAKTKHMLFSFYLEWRGLYFWMVYATWSVMQLPYSSHHTNWNHLCVTELVWPSLHNGVYILDFLPFLLSSFFFLVDVFPLIDDYFDITFVQKTLAFIPFTSIYSKFKLHCWPDAR